MEEGVTIVINAMVSVLLPLLSNVSYAKATATVSHSPARSRFHSAEIQTLPMRPSRPRSGGAKSNRESSATLQPRRAGVSSGLA